MLEIKPCFDARTVASYCRKCGRLPGAGCYLYIASDSRDGTIAAAGLFEVGGDSVRAVYYESAEHEDFYMFDGILRAGLNYASSQGIEKGIVPEGFRQEHKDKFDMLNYPSESEISIVNFFTKYKNCK